MIPNSLGKATVLVNISPSQSNLKCYGIMLPAMPASRNKVIYRYWLLSSEFCKTSWIFLHDPVCPKTGPVLSKNLARSVLKPGPFCPGTWSVLSLDVVRFVLKRGPSCLVRFVHGPFCPSTIISSNFGGCNNPLPHPISMHCYQRYVTLAAVNNIKAILIL